MSFNKLYFKNWDNEYLKRYFIFSFLMTFSSQIRLLLKIKYINPNDWFNRRVYLLKYPDVEVAKMEPFLHYLEFGKEEGRNSKFESEEQYFELATQLTGTGISKFSALILKNILSLEDVEILQTYFDKYFYRHQLRLWRYLPSFLYPLHYALKGHKDDLSPSVIFTPWELSKKLDFFGLVKGFEERKNVGVEIDNVYHKWIKENEVLDEASIQREIDKFQFKPLVSIVLPVYNAPVDYLKQAIESVDNQLYTNWEICISDDASTSIDTINYLRTLRCDNIKVVWNKENGHISRNSNMALNIAKGEFVGLLDQDDTLAPNALFEVVKALNNNTRLSLIFSAEDKIDEQNVRSLPYFKKRWNYRLLLGQNFVNHFGVYRKSVLEGIGGFREGFEGSQDYDMLLRFIEKIEESQITYIDKILYHWRTIQGSVALNVGEKNYAWEAGKRAIESHLKRIGEEAEVMEGLIPIYYRVKKVLKDQPLVSIIIPTKNHLSDLKVAVDSVLNNNTYTNFELIIVDNNSTEEDVFRYYDELKEEYRNIKVFDFPGEFNYSAINNFAVKQSNGDLILLLNNDVEAINKDWLEEMIAEIQPENVGAVGAKLLYPDETIQHAGVEIGMGGVAGHIYKMESRNSTNDFGRIQLAQNYDACTAACLLIKRKVFDLVEGLDERNLKVAFNDIDLCLKIRKENYNIIYTPYAELFHYESKSRGSDLEGKKLERFRKEVEWFNAKWK